MVLPLSTISPSSGCCSSTGSNNNNNAVIGISPTTNNNNNNNKLRRSFTSSSNSNNNNNNNNNGTTTTTSTGINSHQYHSSTMMMKGGMYSDIRHYYNSIVSYIQKSSSAIIVKNNDNVPFILATASVFLFFGIHNYMQELIQYEFSMYNLKLNVMLGYFEVFGVCLFTYLERFILMLRSSSSSSSNNMNNTSSRNSSNNTNSTQTIHATMEEGQNHHHHYHKNSSNNLVDQDTTKSSTSTTTTTNQNIYSTVYTRKAPLSVYPFLTLCLLSSSALSNLSLNYINFPTKVVFRSCKLLPTMVLATVLHPNTKKFTLVEYICATIVCCGLICFGMAEFQTQPTFHPIGILFVSLSVFADALLPNAQERVFVQYHAPRNEVTFYTNLFTLFIMTITTYMSNDLSNCFHFMYEHSKITFYILLYTIISYIAISCHMNVVHLYGGVAAVLVATGRKAMTLIVSFLLFPKIYTIYYPIGTILVLSGLTWASLSKVYNNKNNSKKSEKIIHTTNTTQDDSSASVIVPLLPSSLKTHDSNIMNDDDTIMFIDNNNGNTNDYHNNHNMNRTTIPNDGR